MNTVILDPNDPTRAIVGSTTDPTFGAYVGGENVIGNIHSAEQCAGRPCVIHAPTDHHMREWELHWRDDRGIFERICHHDDRGGCGHPDPDQFDYWRETDQEFQAVHGCDGCCRPPA